MARLAIVYPESRYKYISKELLRNTLEGKRRRGRPRNMWLDSNDWELVPVGDLGAPPGTELIGERL